MKDGPQPTPDGKNADDAHERQWLEKNLPIFWSVATSGFRDEGRGAVIVDVLTETACGNPFSYVPQATLNPDEHNSIADLIQTYDPNHEFVIVLLKDEEHTTAYQVHVHFPGGTSPQFSLS